MGDNRRSGSGSYLVMQQMKDTYHHGGRLGSPSARLQATRFGSPPSQHLLSEIQRLQVANAKLNAKLAFATNRVPGLSKMLGMKESSDGGLPPGGSGPLGRREDSATMAAGRAPRASADSGSGPGMELTIDDLLLSEEEVHEAAMRCCWLARYWTLAEQLGICDDVAHEKATYWQALALPLPTYFEIAKCAVMPHVMVKHSTRPREANCQVAEGSLQPLAAGSSTTHAPVEQASSEPIAPMPEGVGGGATVVDVVELERALRQLSELGVVQEVLSSLMHHRQAVHTAQLQACIENYDPDDTPAPPKVQPGLSTISNTAVAGSMQQGGSFSVEARQPEEDAPPSSSGSTETTACEAQEVAFQRAWLAFIWSRAAALGVELQICRERAEHWGHLLLWGSANQTAHPRTRDSPFAAAFAHNQVASGSGNVGAPGAAPQQLQPSAGASMTGTHAKELMEVHAGLQELARLGVDQQMWAKRGM